MTYIATAIVGRAITVERIKKGKKQRNHTKKCSKKRAITLQGAIEKSPLDSTIYICIFGAAIIFWSTVHI